ncbi:hypothetical protein ACIBQ1_03520 [Nonomuraea sp. NPDC050153]|uniref:hypothetical protein n=1 Tax=Nonomuraea sp. NPDC050153 TaxID=3364359 RepID=UPI0037A3324F
MSVQPDRPVFTESQVLAAADLTLTVDHAAAAQARHERTLHTWGIAAGLRLVPARETPPGGGTAFVRVSLDPGLAIDGTGRQIVVAAAQQLDEGLFEQVNGTAVTPGNRTTWFPVFLTGRDQDPPASGGTTSLACGGQTAATRVVEGFEIGFGRAGDEQDLDRADVPPIDEGPGRPGSTPWRVLLGFVQWNPDIHQFNDVCTTANGVSVRYAGALADEVAARSGRLELRSRAVPALGTPAAVVDEQDGGRMYFGLHDGQGNVTPLLTVTGTGDVTATGTIRGRLTDFGGVLVQSGRATDGMVLPLPDGITADEVSSGKVVLHTVVVPHVPPSAAPGTKVFWIPARCDVDADRRLHCQVTWFGGFTAADRETLPASCDYVVLATAASKAGP